MPKKKITPVSLTDIEILERRLDDWLERLRRVKGKMVDNDFGEIDVQSYDLVNRGGHLVHRGVSFIEEGCRDRVTNQPTARTLKRSRKK